VLASCDLPKLALSRDFTYIKPRAFYSPGEAAEAYYLEEQEQTADGRTQSLGTNDV